MCTLKASTPERLPLWCKWCNSQTGRRTDFSTSHMQETDACLHATCCSDLRRETNEGAAVILAIMRHVMICCEKCAAPSERLFSPRWLLYTAGLVDSSHTLVSGSACMDDTNMTEREADQKSSYTFWTSAALVCACAWRGRCCHGNRLCEICTHSWANSMIDDTYLTQTPLMILAS